MVLLRSATEAMLAERAGLGGVEEGRGPQVPDRAHQHPADHRLQDREGREGGPLGRDAADVDLYISVRTREGVSDHTIYKELVVLRKASGDFVVGSSVLQV